MFRSPVQQLKRFSRRLAADALCVTLFAFLLWTTSATATLMWGNYVPTTSPAWEPTWQAGYPTAVTSTDVNGDAFTDLITVNSSSSFTILTNDAGKGFVRSETVSAGILGPVSLAIADANGDGSLDFISANTRAANLSVFTNGPTGFRLSSSPQMGFMPYDQWPYMSVRVSVTAGDLNGDGLVDLVSSDLGPVFAPYGNTLTVLTNAGGGVFNCASILTAGNSPGDILSIDVNRDGWPDLIVGNLNSDTVSVFTNDCAGNLYPSALSPVGSKPWCLAASDINTDGHTDIVCGNVTGRTLSLLTNNGVGGFFTASTILLEEQPCSVAAADVNAIGMRNITLPRENDRIQTKPD